jgi:hypothetical protein
MTSPPTLKLWPIPVWAYVPILLVLATSVSFISWNLQVDRLYASMMLVAIFGPLGAGWAFNLPMGLVIGQLPFIEVTALLVVRLGQNLGGARLHEVDEQENLREKV